MGTDYANGNEESRVDYYACARKGKSKLFKLNIKFCIKLLFIESIGFDLGKTCKKSESCVSRGCGCTMSSCHCIATNYR
jgi:hypothetical protein